MARAVKARWPIPQVLRESLVKQLRAILEDSKADVRARVSAAKALLTADQLNMAQERQDLERQVLERIEALERELARADRGVNTEAPGGSGGEAASPKPKRRRKATG